jgi:RNA polymerase sigma-70 factor (ECF subfamily)
MGGIGQASRGGGAVVFAEVRVDSRADAFAQLVDRRLNDSYRLAGYILGNAADAEDAVQEAIVRGWQAWGRLRESERLEPWFDRIVVNVCRDRLRRRRTIRFVELDEGIGVHGTDPFAAALARVEVDRIVGVLDVDQRAIVLLRFWRDLQVDEIAERLGMPSGTVKSKLHYALRALRDAAERQAAGGVQ